MIPNLSYHRSRHVLESEIFADYVELIGVLLFYHTTGLEVLSINSTLMLNAVVIVLEIGLGFVNIHGCY